MSDEHGNIGDWATRLDLDQAHAAFSRVGVVDVGSNSVRMVVFDGAARSPAYFYNEKVLCGLGRGLDETGHLHPEGRVRALSALRRFRLVAESMGALPLKAVATAAMREATDGPEFQAEVLAQTGLDLRVIDGQEEARLSAQGVLLGWPEARGIVCDIGGSSLELARIEAGGVGACATAPIGPFRLQKISDDGARRAVVRAALEAVKVQVPSHGERFYLVGGSWRAIARLDMLRRKYPMKVLHEYRMQPDHLLDTLDWIAQSNLSDLRAQIDTGAERMALVPLASLVLREIIACYQPCEVDVSAYGIREGLLYEHMPQSLRQRDPLIEAAYSAEQTLARVPGTGQRMYDFLHPLFVGESQERLRLVKAACLMHDTTWRTHPDYRAEACFDNVTRANLGGLSHSERVFLGLALLHRYKNSRKGSRLEPLLDLLGKADVRAAEILGKAMRFGAMLVAEDPARAGRLEWDASASSLTLHLTPLGAELFGEVAQTRYKALGLVLGATTQKVLCDL